LGFGTKEINMRRFTKSIFSYTWSTSLFGFQQMVNLFTPQGWRQTQRAAESFERITKATAEEMSDVVESTFMIGDNLQKAGVDITFDLFTLGIFDRGRGRPASAGTSSDTSGRGVVSNLGEQAVNIMTQGLQVVGQTVRVVGQSFGGVVPGQGCADSRCEPTGWGPVSPPPSSGSSS
jgi:hypothetical protein